MKEGQSREAEGQREKGGGRRQRGGARDQGKSTEGQRVERKRERDLGIEGKDMSRYWDRMREEEDKQGRGREGESLHGGGASQDGK